MADPGRVLAASLLLATLCSCRPWDDTLEELQLQQDSGNQVDTSIRGDPPGPDDTADPEDSAEPIDTGPEPVTDADGDGYDDMDFGGTDCNDQNDEIHPRAGDSTGDWVDSDCDNLDCQAGASDDGSYFVVCPDEVSWEDAASVCLEAGYDGLALIENGDQQDRIVELSEELSTKAYRELWFGMNDIEEEGEWTWMSGESSYSYWLSGQPGGESDDSDCGMMPNYDGYRWSDLPCSHLYRFVCSG